MHKARWLAGLLWLALSQPAQAHSPVPGIEGFYVGLWHPFSTPSQALVMLGTGLLISGLDRTHYPHSLGTFLAVTLVTLFSGAWLTEPDVAVFGTATLVCALAALWPKPFLPVALGGVVIAGVMIGQISIPDPGPARDRVITMAGSFVGANIGLFYLVGAVIFLKDRFPQHWVEVAFRVMATWLGAIALVMLALQFALTRAAG